MGFVELHFHLLPAIDDGPSSNEESLALAKAVVRDGTRTVVATPHVHPQFVTVPTEIPARVAALSEYLRRRRIPLEVLPGGEISHVMVGRLTSKELEAIAHGPKRARWVLLEAPFDGLDKGFTEAANELRLRGFAVVMAHPERAAQTRATAIALEHELAAGTVLQLTAGSFTGLFGEQARRAAPQLLSSPRTVIASDAHGSALGRIPALTQTLCALAASGEPRPRRYVESNPRLLLERGLTVRPTRLVA